MSSNHSALVAASASAYVCHNPHCTSRRTSFASEKAFTMHCQQSPACLVFIRNEVCGTGTTTTIPSHSTDVEHNATAVNNPVMTSSKQASHLHCEVTNCQHVGDGTAKDFISSNDDTNQDEHCKQQ
jgi:hypothetical protein